MLIFVGRIGSIAPAIASPMPLLTITITTTITMSTISTTNMTTITTATVRNLPGPRELYLCSQKP
uniref:Uncharacterized protein n=1 Tax=Rhizophora mucronata TaxID=61149 RepID=A0A2P2PD30_RHIMU